MIETHNYYFNAAFSFPRLLFLILFPVLVSQLPYLRIKSLGLFCPFNIDIGGPAHTIWEYIIFK